MDERLAFGSGFAGGRTAADRRAPETPAPQPAAAVTASRPGKVTRFKVMYWQEIPSQVKAEDDAGNEVSVELDKRFAERIDAVAHQRGFQQGDAYMAQWKWGDEQERAGSARQVAEAVKAELESSVKW